MYMVSHMVLHLLELPIWMLMLVFAMTPRTNHMVLLNQLVQRLNVVCMDKKVYSEWK